MLAPSFKQLSSKRAAARRERFGVGAAAAATPVASLARAFTRHHANCRALLYYSIIALSISASVRQEAQPAGVCPRSDRPFMRFDKDAVSDGLERPNLQTNSRKSQTTSGEKMTVVVR